MNFHLLHIFGGAHCIQSQPLQHIVRLNVGKAHSTTTIAEGTKHHTFTVLLQKNFKNLYPLSVNQQLVKSFYSLPR